jgi:hypothetical protein
MPCLINFGSSGHGTQSNKNPIMAILAKKNSRSPPIRAEMAEIGIVVNLCEEQQYVQFLGREGIAGFETKVQKHLGHPGSLLWRCLTRKRGGLGSNPG